jgi:hypothetical protein
VANWKEFRFVIEGSIDGQAISPLTLPMARLAEYLTDLAMLMGHRESVHLVNVAEGGAESVMFVDAEEESRITHQIRSAARGMGTRDANAAYRKLDDKLREDDAIGNIVNVSQKAKVIEFPGRTLDLPQAYGPIKERASVIGKLMRIGGFDKTIPVHLKRADDVIFYCETSTRLAEDLGPLLFKNIRVHGLATYSRGKEGAWRLDNFKIQSYDPEPLTDENFSTTMDRLRAIPGSEWNEIADPLDELKRIRHGEEKTTP